MQFNRTAQVRLFPGKTIDTGISLFLFLSFLQLIYQFPLYNHPLPLIRSVPLLLFILSFSFFYISNHHFSIMLLHFPPTLRARNEQSSLDLENIIEYRQDHSEPPKHNTEQLITGKITINTGITYPSYFFCNLPNL